MLNPYLASVIDAHGHFVPQRMSDSLRMPIGQLAKLVNVHRNTLAKNPDSPLVQERLGEMGRIIATASELMSGDASRAIVWFRYQPLSGFDGRTAEELVADGHADAVLEHLESLRDGVYS